MQNPVKAKLARGELVASMTVRLVAGVEIVRIAKAAGFDAQALVDLMGGQIAMRFDQVSTSPGHVKAGKLRALAVTSQARSPVLPGVPSLHELGFTGFDDVTWNGIVAPAATPREVIARLHAAVAKALANPELKRKYGERGIELVASRSPEEFSAYLRSEAETRRKLVQDAGIQIE